MAGVVPSEQLIESFQATLPAPVISHSKESPAYDLYEVYLFGLVVEAAESIGMTTVFLDVDETPVTRLTFRTAPSTMWSPGGPFSHALLEVNSIPRLEVHLGVYVRASSGVAHEADILVIEAAEGARSRALGTHPRAGYAVAVLEAKFHGANLRLRTGREFLGLVSDVGARAPILVSSSPGASVHRLLSYRGRSGHFDLVPGAKQEGELRGQIATRLRDYLARH